MPWMNQLQLEKKYIDPKFQTTFAELFALHLFLETGLVSSEYKPPDTFGDAISLTSTGKEWVPRIQETIRRISLSEINLALFVKFFHHELFIDVTSTNPEAIQNIVDAEIADGRIRYPWIYDRLLYDRFFDMFSSETDELSYEATTKLLQNTPQGVFQLRDVLVGPFGALNSSCHRFLPPARSVPLWHCSDPSCDALHPVLLSAGKNKVLEAVTFISNESKGPDGPPSEWFEFFLNFAGMPDHYDDMQLETLPWLLVNAFGESEIRNILRRLIEQYSKEMRQRFPKPKRFKHVLSRSAQKISEEMPKAQCFQLILLMPDEAVAGCVESLIDEQVINIPSTETRTPGVTYRGIGGWFHIGCECSRFGVHSVSRQKNIAVARLKRLIKELYREKRELAQLQWKLRHVDGKSFYEKLDRYVHTIDPKRIVRDLVLVSSDHIRRAFKILRYGWFALPSSPEEEERLVEKILWKLGFDVGLYPPYQRLFWERLGKFLQTAKTSTTYNEHDMELIRSAGVNFFVSLEEILDYSLSFTTWALLSDHYGLTKFKCNFEETRHFMASRLNGLRLGSNEPLEFDVSGKNTLYPLIQGFAVLAELCSKTIESRNDLKRPENELPGYYDKTEIQLFPFLHKTLILDLRKGDCDRITGLLREITATLEKSQVCNIRNRIEHRRPDFPNQDEIERACALIVDTVNKMEEAGVCPLIYLYTGRTVDQYGRSVVMFKDYREREITVGQPSQYSVCRLPSIRVPQIIVPWMHISDSFELIRFQFEETSDYVEMWREYPKRRMRVPSKELKENFDSE